MTTSPRECTNRLLSSLQGVALERLLPHLTLVDMSAGDSVFASGVPQAYAYFPVTARITLLYFAENGVATDIAVVGNEGMVGIPLFLKGKVSPCSARVRTSGAVWRIPAAVLTSELNRSGPALRVILGYARGLTAQMERFAGCVRDCADNRPSHTSCGYPETCLQAG